MEHTGHTPAAGGRSCITCAAHQEAQARTAQGLPWQLRLPMAPRSGQRVIYGMLAFRDMQSAGQ